MTNVLPEPPLSLPDDPQMAVREFDTDQIILDRNILEGVQIGYIVEGLVKMVSPHGASRISMKDGTLMLHGELENSWFGLKALFHGRHFCHYIAATDCRVRLVPLSWIRNEAPRELLANLLYHTSHMLSTQFGTNLVNRMSTEKRILGMLIDIRAATPYPEIPLTQADIASMVQTERSVTSRTLKTFEKRGLLQTHYGNLMLADLSTLKNHFNELEDADGS